MKIYNIFISHAWKYSDDYNTIVSWLDRAKANGELNWKDYSVPEHDPKFDPKTQTGKRALKEELKKQIAPASVVLVIAGMYVAYSDWIDFEIDTALDMEKYIVGIRPRGSEKTPRKVEDNADVMVNWNSKSLIDAIKASS